MKISAFAIFFTVVFVVYFLVNLYIYRHGLLALPKGTPFRVIFSWGFWIIAISFPLGRIIERMWISPVTDTIIWAGSFWLAAMLYLFIACITIDILRLTNLIYPWITNLVDTHGSTFRLWSLVGVIGTVFLIVLAGHINAVTMRISHHALNIAKDAGSIKKLRIVAVSDIHMGTIIAKHRVSKLVHMVNEQQPDIVLLAGDIVDEDLAPVIRRNLGKSLEQIKSRLGTYAITGNHEYIGGADAAVRYLQQHGVKVLRDSVVLIDDAFYVAGRDDRDSRRFEHQNRMEVSQLLSSTDKHKPIILLDHQPYNLDSAANAGVDLQVSGHTHHGQLWPLSYITQGIFELSSGYLRKGNTHFIVSNGYGSWGPPVRLGNRPEILVIDLTFETALK